MKKLTIKEKRLVNTAWKQLEEFINDWKHSPYKWDTERDIQAEISSRLRRAYGKLNDYEAYYTKWATEGYKQLYSRVACEPLAHYTDDKGRRNPCKPDIVIFRDLEDPHSPPDEDARAKKNRPILLVCEIKYNTEMTPTNNLTSTKQDKDLDKLSCLRKHNETAYACWLVISRRKKADYPETYTRSGRFRSYYVKLQKRN